MSNDLIPADVFGAISTQVGTDEDFADLGTTTKFLQRLELKSKGVLIDIGKVKPGHYAVIKSSEDADDLGDTIDILVVARKPKAIDMNDPEQIIVTYERHGDVFKDIEQRAGKANSRCQYGATFLIIERSTARCYEFFCGSASNRREIPTLSDYMPITAEQIKARQLEGVKPHGPLALTLKSKRVENKARGFSWFVPVPKPCSNPFTAEQIPPADVIRQEIEKFLKPDENGPKVESGATAGRAR